MASEKPKEPAVVNFDAVKKAFGMAEAVHKGSADDSLTAPQRAAALAWLGEALRELKKASLEADSDVLVCPQNAAASLLQSYIASGENADSEFLPLGPGGREVKFDTKDLLGWARSLLDWIHFKTHELVRPDGVRIEGFPDEARIAILGDWGTGLYGGSPCARRIEEDPGRFDMLLHLGDVYYSGTREEVQERFLQQWPHRRDAVSRALNSNHEMYSGGYGYFDLILPTFQQPSSYFAWGNKHWLLVFLDTGYIDHDLDQDQTRWLHDVLEHVGDRKVVFFSHHQLFSALESQGTKLAGKLLGLLQSRRITAWYWAHEHRCILYDRHADYGLIARCVGHGAMPYFRKPVASAPVEQQVGEFAWRRLPGAEGVPASLVLDGPNRYIPGKEHKYGPNGYATLEFQGPDLVERIWEPGRSQPLFENAIR